MIEGRSRRIDYGRGTSTFDGLALASGIAAHLHGTLRKGHAMRHVRDGPIPSRDGPAAPNRRMAG